MLKLITGWHNVQLEINERIFTFTVDDRPIFTENKKLLELKPIAVELFDFEKNLFYIGEFVCMTTITLRFVIHMN